MRRRNHLSTAAAGLLLALLVTLLPTPARSASTTVLITAVFYETYLDGDPDEAFRITNVGSIEADLMDWTVTDFEGTLTLTDTLPAGESFWIAREAAPFTEEFGFKPNYEYGTDTDPGVDLLVKDGSFLLANIA